MSAKHGYKVCVHKKVQDKNFFRPELLVKLLILQVNLAQNMKSFIVLFGVACIFTVSYSKGKYMNKKTWSKITVENETLVVQ